MEEMWQDILLPRQTLDEVLGQELAKQYRLRWGQDCVYMPVSNGTDCLCVCGGVNPAGQACAACKRVPKIPSRQELEELRKEAAQRLAQEEALRAEQEARQLEEAARLRRQKHRRIVKACLISVGALALTALAAWGIICFAVPAYHYGQAHKALERENYQLAHREFTRAGEYRDAKDYLSRFYTPELTVRMDAPKIGSFQEYTYDSAGRVIKKDGEQFAKDGQGDSPTTFWWGYVRENDEDGRITVYETASERREYFYDHRGDLTRAVVYDKEGNLKNSYTFLYWYDEEDRLFEQEVRCISRTLPDTGFVQTDVYAYDEAGNMIFRQTAKDYPQKPSSGFVTTTHWRYDAQGRQLERTLEMKSDPNAVTNLTEEEYWTYDEAGNILTHRQKTVYAQDPANNADQLVTHSYDSGGRLTELVTQCRFPENPARNYEVRFTQEYDEAGRRIRLHQQTQYESQDRQRDLAHSRTEEYVYDRQGRLVKEVRKWDYPEPAESFTETETITYSISGVKESSRTVTQMKENTSEQIEIYNENGLLAELQVRNGTEQTRWEYTYAYFYFEDGVLPAEFVDPLEEWTPLQLYG